MKYSDKQRLEKIVSYINKLNMHLAEKQISKEVLLQDEAAQWLVTTPVYNIGEQVYYLSKEFKETHTDIPWSMISGLRHRLVHNYDGTNWEIISEVVFEELPELKKHVESYLKEMGNS